MLCYKDRAFCMRLCGNLECPINQKHIDHELVKEIGLPIAYRKIKECKEWREDGCVYQTYLKMKRGGCIEDFMQILLTNGYGCRIIPTKEDGFVEIKILEVNNAED